MKQDQGLVGIPNELEEFDDDIYVNLNETNTPLFLESPSRHYSAGSNRKHIIAVSSSGKGGTGKSTTAVNLALSYQEKNKNTALVDFDLPLGDINTMLGMSDERCISDFFNIPADLGDDKVRENLMLTYHNGLKVLPALRNIHDLCKVNQSRFVDMLLHHLQSFDVVVVDTGPNFEESTLHILKKATDVVMVSDDYQTTFHNIYKGRQVLLEVGVDISNICLAVNRANNLDDQRLLSISNITGIKAIFFLPFVKEMPDLVDVQRFMVGSNSLYTDRLDTLMNHLTPELYANLKGSNDIKKTKLKRKLLPYLFKRRKN